MIKQNNVWELNNNIFKKGKVIKMVFNVKDITLQNILDNEKNNLFIYDGDRQEFYVIKK